MGGPIPVFATAPNPDDRDAVESFVELMMWGTQSLALFKQAIQLARAAHWPTPVVDAMQRAYNDAWFNAQRLRPAWEFLNDSPRGHRAARKQARISKINEGLGYLHRARVCLSKAKGFAPAEDVIRDLSDSLTSARARYEKEG